MDEKKTLYTIKWTQPYTEWALLQESVVELQLEHSDWTESESVINYIRGLK